MISLARTALLRRLRAEYEAVGSPALYRAVGCDDAAQSQWVMALRPWRVIDPDDGRVIHFDSTREGAEELCRDVRLECADDEAAYVEYVDCDPPSTRLPDFAPSAPTLPRAVWRGLLK